MCLASFSWLLKCDARLGWSASLQHVFTSTVASVPFPYHLWWGRVACHHSFTALKLTALPKASISTGDRSIKAVHAGLPRGCTYCVSQEFPLFLVLPFSFYWVASCNQVATIFILLAPCRVSCTPCSANAEVVVITHWRLH